VKVKEFFRKAADYATAAAAASPFTGEAGEILTIGAGLLRIGATIAEAVDSPIVAIHQFESMVPGYLAARERVHAYVDELVKNGRPT
jgi:hypothetical protein